MGDFAIVVPRQPVGKNRYRIWNRFFVSAKTIALHGTGVNRDGYILPSPPGKKATPEERCEWARWRRAAWCAAHRVRFRRKVIVPKYRLIAANMTRIPSRRELEVLAYKARGYTVKEIADGLRYKSLGHVHGMIKRAGHVAGPYITRELTGALDRCRKVCVERARAPAF